MAASLLRRLLAHPLTASLDLDDPATTQLRRDIIASKPFLRAIYDEWYTLLAESLPPGKGVVVELGSGAGYCARFIPGLVTSEVFPCPGVQIAANATQLPFASSSLLAIVMSNVFHHLPDVRRFLAEAARCLQPGGKILMIEPWVTPWSRVIYSHLHHEPFQPDAREWTFPSSGPLSGANGALPWIVFARDRAKFAVEFPQFSIEQVRPFLPFRYLVSGGVAMRNLMPGFTHGAWAGLERALRFQMPGIAMFAFIALRKGPGHS
ncbi:MAG: methyltransferase domain-containing protein [Candidatus Acidiferrum sp.]